MSVQESPAPAPARRSTSLKREVGLIGLMWASVGSIIGSGWLFGAQEGLIAAGPAAMISWIVGGLMMMVLALIHAELGGMYPVSGGTARFPHYAFGGAAGASFGWFSWLQAATVAPIEVSAMITYAQHYSFAAELAQPDDQGADHHRPHRRRAADGAADVHQLPRDQEAGRREQRRHVVEDRGAACW